MPRVVMGLVLAGLCGSTCTAMADGARTLDVGLAPALVVGMSNACQREFDVVSCSGEVFAGADVSAHLWLLDLVGIGARVSLAKDLDASEVDSSDGISFDPKDLYLIRATLEGKIDPPLLPDGLWAGVELGVGLMHELHRYRPQVGGVTDASATQTAPLLGAAIGWDFWLGDVLTLTPEVRGQLLFFGDPPDFREDVSAHDYGASAWLEFALRLAFAPRT